MYQQRRAQIDFDGRSSRSTLGSHCPACKEAQLTRIHAVASVPTQSAILLESIDETLAFPRGVLDFAQCDVCGFITNLAFKPSLVTYDARYEGSQMASPTFVQFARSLAQRVIEQHALHGKPILEIGCGQGEFLTMLCELSDSTGVGYDPAYRERSRQDQRVRIVDRSFDESTTIGDAACVVCRHTLEHISDPRRFVRTIRAAIGDREDVIVFFEVPNADRILREGAFWDLFYEHCSNFSRKSLTRLFHDCGFEVVELDSVYEGQYLVLTARPRSRTRRSVTSGVGQVPSFEKMRTPHEDFRTRIAQSIAYWNLILDDAQIHDQRVAIWGSGSKAVGFLIAMRDIRAVRAIVDLNPARRGRFMPGIPIPICSPDDLTLTRPDLVIIMNPVYRDEIERDLHARGHTPRILTLS